MIMLRAVRVRLGAVGLFRRFLSFEDEADFVFGDGEVGLGTFEHGEVVVDVAYGEVVGYGEIVVGYHFFNHVVHALVVNAGLVVGELSHNQCLGMSKCSVEAQGVEHTFNAVDGLRNVLNEEYVILLQQVVGR